ncbi:MAG TPA: nucleotidyl transferase AbiEii/AbiGii toxin family protein [Nitrospinota bacterium]|nr:nucleotidyl transferase AbiEii/AbiGii toxin family protein [Nitrospinota bacterium]
MNKILFDISEKIEPSFVDALYEFNKVASSLDIPFFIVGATARDFILEYCFGIKSPRMTRDIDLGIVVANWDKFNRLSKTLLSNNNFSKDKEKQRYIFKDVFIDIVPFGPISDKDKKISWPPEHEIIMSTLGFKEAYDSSVNVKLSSEPELYVKLPTLPGLAIMKLISWKEKYPARKRDAEDLLFIMNKYEEAGNLDRLYETESTLFIEEGSNARLACIRLLGRDMAKISNTDTLEVIKKILDVETCDESKYHLVTHMVGRNDNFDEILIQLEKLKQGIFESSSD